MPWRFVSGLRIIPGFSRSSRHGGTAVGQSPLGSAEAGRDSPSLRLLSAIVNSSDDAIVGKTPDGVITSWNPAAERMYGYSAEEIVGQPVTVLSPPGHAGEIKEILDKIGRSERVLHQETVRRRKDGTIFPVSVTVSPVYDEGGRLVGASSIARDISKQQRAAAEVRRWADDLERANRNLETFTYSVSHDLRAPLRAMSGFSAALLEDCGDALGDDGRGYAERIQAAGEQMARLIDDLLHLSGISRAEMNLQTIDLGAEADRIAKELQHDGPDRSVRFVIQRPVWALADLILIRTVLQNLLDNAWKFTSRRDDALIEFGTTPVADADVCCYVRDNGAGFDPAYVGKLFTPFQRLHTTREFPGTGVGLASLRQIVERHGGHAWAEGAVGEGATFYFTLDAKERA
jgi:PAS domain S-box-containing protein